MNIRLALQLPVLALWAALGAACGNTDDDDDGSGGTTCESICARQNELCSDNQNCSAICSAMADVAATTGCGPQYQEALDCLAEKDMCDDQETLCPGDSVMACIDAYCAANSADFC